MHLNSTSVNRASSVLNGRSRDSPFKITFYFRSLRTPKYPLHIIIQPLETLSVAQVINCSRKTPDARVYIFFKNHYFFFQKLLNWGKWMIFGGNSKDLFFWLQIFNFFLHFFFIYSSHRVGGYMSLRTNIQYTYTTESFCK